MPASVASQFNQISIDKCHVRPKVCHVHQCSSVNHHIKVTGTQYSIRVNSDNNLAALRQSLVNMTLGFNYHKPDNINVTIIRY